MFSASLELILNVAYREATSRGHTHLTLEHLLYALAHDPAPHPSAPLEPRLISP